MKKIWIFCLLIAAIIFIDQVTKSYIEYNFFYGESYVLIEGFFNFTYVKNPGAAFGMGANASSGIRKALFVFLPMVACLVLLYLIWHSRRERFVLGLSYSLIFAGAMGNLIDRIMLGYVVDFLDFHYGPHHFPSFNVADSSISIAAGLLIIDSLCEMRKLRILERSKT